MAVRLPNGSIQMADGRIVYANTPVLAQDICELVPILCPPPENGGAIFPGLFRGGSGGSSGGFGGPGGGGGSGSPGPQGVPGPIGLRGLQGPPGPINQIQDEGLNLPVQNTLNFLGSGVSAVDNPGTGATDVTIPGTDALFEAKLQRDTATTISLQAFEGKLVTVNGELVDVLAGFSRTNLDNLITATGADSGAGPVANTVYYTYVSNSQATFSPLSIRLSSTAPTLVGGVRYLGVAGNALNWRYVSKVKTGAGSTFSVALTQPRFDIVECRILKNNQEVYHNNDEKNLTFDTVDFDFGIFFDPAAPTLITIPENGVYEFKSQEAMILDVAGAGNVETDINVTTGPNFVIAYITNPVNAGGGVIGLNLSGLRRCVAGEQVVVEAGNFTGQDITMALGAGVLDDSFWVSARKVSP